MENERQNFEEIDIIKCLRTIVKHKKIIFSFFLIFALLSFILSMFFLGKNKIEATIQIGQLNGKYLETSDQVVQGILNGVYGNYDGLNASAATETDFVKLQIDNVKNIEAAKTFLENTINSILTKQNNSRTANEKIREERIKELQAEIDYLLSRNKEVENLQLALFNEKMGTINFSPSKIHQDISIVSSKPNLAFNLIIGAVLGLFLGICWIFAREWWRKNKDAIVKN
jgi:LPS O-antigen subunit length determinant protein (WzzB/FepE family)